MIKPTIGRVVLVQENLAQVQWWPAQICAVYSNHTISVAGFQNNGQPFSLERIPLIQNPVATDSVFVPENAPQTPYACWMPYQRQQQIKNEQIDNATLANNR